MSILRIAFLPSLFAAVLTVAACGGDDDEGNGGATTSPVATTADATEDAGDARPGVIEVEAADFSFTPDAFDAPLGEVVSVEVTNTGDAPHTLTVYGDEEYSEPINDADTGNIDGGGTAEFTIRFDEAGTYFFRCDIHTTQMQGEITVE